MTTLSTPSTAQKEFIKLLQPSKASYAPRELDERLDALRQRILVDGLPRDAAEAGSIRPVLWKLLLGLHRVSRTSLSHAQTAPAPASNVVPPALHALLDTDTYQSLISRDPSPMFAKIRNDSFRTLATDQQFLHRVGEERLVRLLEAFVWRQLDRATLTNNNTQLAQPPPSPPPIDAGTPYVQGMNVLAAPFLFVLPSQIEAFGCFTSFIEQQCPRYVRPAMEGVHAGLKLVDLCLQQLDPQLYAHLLAHNLRAELYAFPSLLTFGAATPPLEEVLELWDFLLAWGVGLNVVAVVAQVHMIREGILNSSSPMKLLRVFPDLKTREIIILTVSFVHDCPKELYEAVMRHPWDDSLVLE